MSVRATSAQALLARGGKTNNPLRSVAVMVLGVAMLSLSGCASVDPDAGVNEFNTRLYVGGGVLVSQLDPDADGDPNVSVDNNQSAGGSFAAGYDLSSRFAVEGHVAALGAATLEPSGDIEYQVAGLSALLYGLNNPDNRARRQRFSLFGRLGVGAMRNQSDLDFNRVNDFHVLAGLGVEYGFASGVALRAEIVGHETDAKYAQLGVIYRFGDTGAAPVPEPSVAVADDTPLPTVTAVPKPAAPATPIPLDKDADGVPDQDDDCLDTGIGLVVDAAGCELFAGVAEGVNFESGSDVLTADAEVVLDGVATTLRAYPTIRIAVEAHTDNQGSADSNLQLSRRRVVAVARYLVEQGIAGNRLKPQAFGESRPIANNANAEGRARNRRVEFQVLQ